MTNAELYEPAVTQTKAELALRTIAMLAARPDASAISIHKDLVNIFPDLEPTYTSVLTARQAFTANDHTGLAKLLDVETLVIDRAVATVTDDLVGLALADEVELIQATKSTGAGVAGLARLNLELQATASRLNQRISSACATELEPRDVQALANALSSIHTTFFGGAATQVAVFAGGEGNQELQRFKQAMSS